MRGQREGKVDLRFIAEFAGENYFLLAGGVVELEGSALVAW